MQTIRTIDALRGAIAGLRAVHDHAAAPRIAFVPTMGALHDGHLALVREGKRQADHVVASIFVNPKQFGPDEDLDSYPRTEARDAALLAAEGVALLWAPDVATMYPAGAATMVSVGRLDNMLCGAARPGHFDGVATVVAKLLNQIGADAVLFGEKDWQQLAIVRRMAHDLDFAIEIIGVPTVREPDGLAMSSRNAYLTPHQRAAAAALPRVLHDVAARLARGEPVADALAAGRTAILTAGFADIDYFDLRDGSTLAALNEPGDGGRLFIAARIGATRLIDNIALS